MPRMKKEDLLISNLAAAAAASVERLREAKGARRARDRVERTVGTRGISPGQEGIQTQVPRRKIKDKIQGVLKREESLSLQLGT